MKTIVQNSNLSDNSEGLFQRGNGEARYRGIFAEKQTDVVYIQILLLITKTDILNQQIKGFSAFPCMGRCKSLGL